MIGFHTFRHRSVTLFLCITNQILDRMKRIFLFMLPMAFSMGAQAYNVNIADTVCTRHREYFKEKWETVQPSYLIDVVSVSTWKDNWFLNVSGGTSAFLGSPLGCEDLFGRMKYIGCFGRQMVHASYRRSLVLSGFPIQGFTVGNTIISILPCGFALECIGRLG